MRLLWLHELLTWGLLVERRFEPFFRRAFNTLFRNALAAILQWAINLSRKDEKLALGTIGVSRAPSSARRGRRCPFERACPRCPSPAWYIRASRSWAPRSLASSAGCGGAVMIAGVVLSAFVGRRPR